MTRAVIVGSSFATVEQDAGPLCPRLRSHELDPVARADPALSIFRLVKHPDSLVLMRHGLPHRYLPNQIPYRAQALALRGLGVSALLCTSSVGLLREGIPLFTPLRVSDLLMPDNRLPDGSACTIWPEPQADQGHLVVDGGLLNHALSQRLEQLAEPLGLAPLPPVVFGYAPGPRTKTAAENAMWARLGADVASMSLAPEIVLANELEIPCAAVVVGHKNSHAGADDALDRTSLEQSLVRAREGLEQLIEAFLLDDLQTDFANRIYRF